MIIPTKLELDEFLINPAKKGEKILVNAEWLQQELKKLNRLQLENIKLAERNYYLENIVHELRYELAIIRAAEYHSHSTQYKELNVYI